MQTVASKGQGDLPAGPTSSEDVEVNIFVLLMEYLILLWGYSERQITLFTLFHTDNLL